MNSKITVAIAILTLIVIISVPTVQAFKLTRTSYTDGYNEGFSDARTGQQYYTNPDHTSVYKEGYDAGYRAGSGGGSVSTQSPSQTQAQTQTQKQGVDIHIEQSQAQSQSQSQR
ncbi:MAG: hypothetical protein WBQ25_02305 [Nitrososphaeraceae archaeon]